MLVTIGRISESARTNIVVNFVGIMFLNNISSVNTSPQFKWTPCLFKFQFLDIVMKIQYIFHFRIPTL